LENEYENLATEIKKCVRCFFRGELIKLLVPENVAVPVDIMFIGENPSWEKYQSVPFDPFTQSGQALETYYLNPLGLSRTQVWITDLFKCRYPKRVYNEKLKYESRIQQEVISQCKVWLSEEISFAKPRVICTLSDKQVYQRFRIANKLSIPTDFEKAVGRPFSIEIDGFQTLLFPLVHPYVSRPVGKGDNLYRGARKKWSPIHIRQHIPALKSLLDSL